MGRLAPPPVKDVPGCGARGPGLWGKKPREIGPGDSPDTWSNNT